ncbi:long-chain acyl-CoA synthetase [Parafrankia irregularis]|uniref:Acyl-CoA synthetase n=1 Tax=Parafrankia irregularis TaxID=795642 RepID=A0A0S4QWS5_9ACTN|nr:MULTISPECIES: long-chain fatty acid--CoA ligase [Parafrankia]MBE3206370.1 long-chain fatty acid--CoA ligase [Parafrankia sp. CH37]CUU60065.1 long-chain acyl-CoA synthetase [Parafrankia irregularis]
MREYASPAQVTVADDLTLSDAIFTNAQRVPNKVIVRHKVNDAYVDMTASEFRDLVVRTAAGLVARGLQPGDRFAIMSRTRYEWTVLDYAVWAAGGITVPIYETSSAAQIEWIMSDSGTVLAVVESDEHAALVAEVRDRLPALREVLVLDQGALDTLGEAGAGTGVGAEELAAARSDVTADSIATVIYTSGTTGRPKGCELSHRALLFNALASAEAMPNHFTEDASTLMFLPLAHVLARTMQCTIINNARCIAYTPDTNTLLADLAKVQPTFILAVPRVFEKVYAGARAKAHADGKGRIFDAAEATAVAYSRALDQGGPGLPLRLKHAVFSRLVYSKLRAALGGNITHGISGGAPLNVHLCHFFRGIGFLILEGYGLTESTAAATVNRPESLKIGTVGLPLPGVTVRIADDGEVLLRGDLVLSGYRNNETAGKEALDSDGFLRTGDLGSLDETGHLRITGRKKEILVTAGGKNVAPAPLEQRIGQHPLVGQAMLVGDQRPFIAALITLDPEAFATWLKANGRPATTTPSDLANDPTLVAEIQQAVDAANATVSHAEAIKKFVILPYDFTIASGELTPSLKVKRNVVMERFADTVEAIYATPRVTT